MTWHEAETTLDAATPLGLAVEITRVSFNPLMLSGTRVPRLCEFSIAVWHLGPTGHLAPLKVLPVGGDEQLEHVVRGAIDFMANWKLSQTSDGDPTHSETPNRKGGTQPTAKCL